MFKSQSAPTLKNTSSSRGSTPVRLNGRDHGVRGGPASTSFFNLSDFSPSFLSSSSSPKSGAKSPSPSFFNWGQSTPLSFLFNNKVACSDLDPVDLSLENLSAHDLGILKEKDPVSTGKKQWHILMMDKKSHFPVNGPFYFATMHTQTTEAGEEIYDIHVMKTTIGKASFDAYLEQNEHIVVSAGKIYFKEDESHGIHSWNSDIDDEHGYEWYPGHELLAGLPMDLFDARPVGFEDEAADFEPELANLSTTPARRSF